jgi:DNA topoisomerase-1
MSKLVICEKNDAAERIAKILSDGKLEKIWYKDKIPFFKFEKNNKEWIVVGLRGHIVALDYPQEYNLWNRVSPKDLIDVAPIKIVSEKQIVELLKKFTDECDEVIVATDYDREGELIGVEGLDIVKTKNQDINVKRARFSSLTKEEISEAFQKLSNVDYNLSKSAECRQIIDLVWGAVLTRFLSLSSNRVGKDFLSVGRVQTPTLAIIVDKEKRIIAFKPEPFWEIVAIVEKGEKFNCRHIKERFLKKGEADSIFSKVKTAKNGKVADVERKEKKEIPPPPFNTTTFLQAATKLGLSAANAMRIAEELYINGYISYPRTDNTIYPPTLNLREILKKLSSTVFADAANEILAKGELKPTRGKKAATDHPPIYPVEPVDKSAVGSDQWKVYELVVRRFLATLAPEAVSEVSKINIDINSEMFIARGYRTLSAGWKKYYPYNVAKETLLPELKKDDIVKVISVEMLEKTTQPPGRFTQGGLIQEMERLGLGTKSTRHEIIQKLYSRNYITGVSPTPTLMGIAVTDALEKHADIITKPDMTSTLEKDMDGIAEGQKKLEDVVKESQEMLHDAMGVLIKNKKEIGETIQQALRKDSIVGKCGKCKGDLLIIKSHRGKRFVGCSGYPKCDTSYPLPQRGTVSATGQVCETCQSPKIKLQSGRRKPIEMCINMKCPGKGKTEKVPDEKEE